MYMKLLGFTQRESIFYVHVTRKWWFNSNIYNGIQNINIITVIATDGKW